MYSVRCSNASRSRQPIMLRWILNSFVVSITVTLGVLVTSSLLAFALSYLDFPGKGLLLFFTLGTLMVPFEATLIPNYLFVARLGPTISSSPGWAGAIPTRG